MTFYKKNKLIIIGGLMVVIAVAVLYIFYGHFISGANYDYVLLGATTTPVYKPVNIHLKTPSSVKGLYLTACAASTPSLRNHVLKLITDTELNAVVVDLKDYTGTVAFPTKDLGLQNKAAGGCTIPNLPELITEWHQQGVYIIGRVTVFQDPYYAKKHPELAVKKADNVTVWRDKKGLSFIDVGAKPYWDYIVSLSKEAYNLGVDELNFDYVRFPSDGNMQDIAFTWSQSKSKPVVLEEFFKYLHEELKPTGAVLSADLFGMTTTNINDLNIGQVLERALPYFDYVDPMVYPSHYPPQFNDWANPNEHPYDLIYLVLKEGARRAVATSTPIEAFTHQRLGTSTPALYRKPIYKANKIRPWLQDFDYGGTYGVSEVQAQIKATYDAGLNSWLIWDPANKYTPAAYKPISLPQ
ncbi:MAG: putative glycoside hydrolase [bacterium]|nr:putative glycoside hydrolase [bacterium]